MAGNATYDGAMMEDARTLLGGATGKWAGEQMLRAANEGRPLDAAVLRTLDTLRHDEWKHFDEELVAEALIQLKGVGDLIGAGLTRPVKNSLGKTVFAYEKITFMDEAQMSMDPSAQTPMDRQEFEMLSLPLPITHKDFSINLRTLVASRERGEPLDTTQVRTAGRVIAEKIEKTLFQGAGKTFQGLPIYGYTNFPERNVVAFGTNGNWDTSNTAKTGSNILADVLSAIEAAQTARFYGPYWLYVSRDASAKLSDDFKAFSSETIMQRLLMVDGIQRVQIVDQLPTHSVILVQATSDVVTLVQGESLQTVQWDVSGGWQIQFKAWEIAVPLIRSDAQGRCGVVHLS